MASKPFHILSLECVCHSIQATKAQVIFQGFPYGDGSKTQENFLGEVVSFLTLRIKVIYSQFSKELAHRMILTSVGSEITVKPVPVSVRF